MFHDADGELGSDVVARDEGVERIGEGHTDVMLSSSSSSPSGETRRGSTYEEPL